MDSQTGETTDALRCPAASGTCELTGGHEMVEVKGMMGKTTGCGPAASGGGARLKVACFTLEDKLYLLYYILYIHFHYILFIID